MDNEQKIEEFSEAVRAFDLAFLRHNRFPTELSERVLSVARVRMGDAREACEKAGIDVESLV